MSYGKGHQFSLKEIDQTQDAGINFSKILKIRLCRH